MDSKKILVVDDERDYCDSFRRYFTRSKHRVDIAYDGLEAADLLKDNTYDYIFFDCNMPEMSGIELIKVIEERSPVAKKIMVSGYTLLTEEFAKFAGVDLFLSKPVGVETIKNIIKDSTIGV